jgi:DNA-binding NarL/FixJ family response regulator
LPLLPAIHFIQSGVCMAYPTQRAGNVDALLRAAQTAQSDRSSVDDRRRLVAQLCRMLGAQYARDASGAALAETEPLSPRLAQTLDALLAGDSEKQIAGKLGISPHTVHVYVKALYKGFGVSSRGELLSRFITRDRARPAPRAQPSSVR